MLQLEGEQALVKRLTTEFPITADQAVTAMNVAWMSLACGSDHLDVPGLVFEQVGDGLHVIENDTMIAVLEFDPGVLPRKVIPFVPRTQDDDDDSGWDAYYEHMDFLEARNAARFG